MKYKKAICVRCKKDKYIYARGLCQYCYKIDSYLKAKKKRESRYCTDWGFKTEGELFESLKCENPHSFISNASLERHLTDADWYMCCHHVLNKDTFPLFRLNPGNIVLLTPYDEHDDIHNKTKAQLSDSWAKYFELMDKLLKSYAKYV